MKAPLLGIVDVAYKQAGKPRFRVGRHASRLSASEETTVPADVVFSKIARSPSPCDKECECRGGWGPNGVASATTITSKTHVPPQRHDRRRFAERRLDSSSSITATATFDRSTNSSRRRGGDRDSPRRRRVRKFSKDWSRRPVSDDHAKRGERPRPILAMKAT